MCIRDSVNGEQTTYKTSVKYPVLAGGISVRKTASGSVGTMAPVSYTHLDVYKRQENEQFTMTLLFPVE